jgi:prolyl-tRNA synthetase
LTFASGGSFSKYSHEFQTLTGAGEDTIYIDENKDIAINKEVYNDEVIENLLIEENEKKEELVELPKAVIENETKKPKSGIIEFPEK